MITELGEVSESRLCWPETKPRAAERLPSAFKGAQVDRETRSIEEEMTRWRIRAFIVSRNNQRIYAGDPAAALWWLDKTKQIRVLACDKWTTLASNLHAIVLTLEAMRGLERWGAYTAEQAAEGARLALPGPASAQPWWEVLGAGRDWPLVAIRAVYREAALKAHPDHGGTAEALKRLTDAMEAAMKEKAP